MCRFVYSVVCRVAFINRVVRRVRLATHGRAAAGCGKVVAPNLGTRPEDEEVGCCGQGSVGFRVAEKMKFRVV